MPAAQAQSSMIQTEAEAFWYLPENLTDSQKHSLAEFRKSLAAQNLLLKDHDDDCTLLRFLKARQWHLEPATAMYKAMAVWRKQEEIDKLYDEYDFPEFHALVEHYPHFYHKQDKYGRPVYIEQLGKTDCTKMLAVTSIDRVMKYHIWAWERLKRVLFPTCSKLMSKPCITCTVIIDLAGLSLKNFSLTARQLLHAVSKIDQDYYPEHLGTMFIINTPYIFKVIWAVVNPLLEERTRKKIMVLGHDYKATLLELIPEENLPEFMGGKSVCDDYMASVGPWMDVEPCKGALWLPLRGKAADGSAK